MQLLYAFSKKEGNTIAEGEKDLFKSISKSTDLYYYIFLLITEIQRKAFLKIDAAKNRKAPTREDLNPNTRFIENPVIAQIAGNRKFKTYINANLISLNDTPEIITKLYNHLTELECYKTYMEKTDISYEDHKKMVLDMIVDLIAQDEEFFETMEEKNIFWNDDFDLVLSIVYKTIKNMKSNFKEEDLFFIALYNEEEDYDFFLENIIESEVFQMIQTVFNQLSPACREVYQLSLQGKSHEEISHLLNISTNTIKKHKNNANHYMREQLKHILSILLYI